MTPAFEGNIHLLDMVSDRIAVYMKSIPDPFKHLWCSFFVKKVNGEEHYRVTNLPPTRA